MRKLILPALLMAFGLTTFGQMTPQEPITNFRLPMFGENGYRTWEMRGDEGRYISPEKIDVIQMKLDIFSGDADSKVENKIRSPKATLLVNKNFAIGDSPIQILNANYRVDGELWFWDGKLRRVVISRNAKVVFNQGLSL